MLSQLRANVLGVSLVLFAGGLLAGEASAGEASPSALPAVSTPVLVAQYSGQSRSNSSYNGVRIPYGVIRLVVLGIMGAGGWLGSKLYR
jgi:hypothetical protein